MEINPLSFLSSLKPEKIKPGLERISFLLKELGNPENNFPAIQISGTNGKGSTLAFLLSIYRKAGYKVGAYTSPHLHRVNERIRIGGNTISCSELENLIDEVKPAFFKAVKKKELGQPSYFEFLTALAFLYFARKKVDLALVEVGIEGRFDATNRVSPVATIITQIEMEHQEYLGSTYPEILTESLSIIREMTPVITSETKRPTLKALKAEAERKRAPAFLLKDVCELKEKEYNLKKQFFDYRGVSVKQKNLEIQLLGKHQIENASLALLTTEVLMSKFPVNEEQLRQGLKEAYWPARFEVLENRGGWIVIDGAHNPSGLEVLFQAIKRHFPGMIPTFIFGVLEDKDYRSMASLLAAKTSEIFLVEPLSSRALPLAKLKKEFLRYNTKSLLKEVKSLAEAVNLASERSELVVITGSLYLAAQARELLGVSGKR